jgi:hypothetical protein
MFTLVPSLWAICPFMKPKMLRDAMTNFLKAVHVSDCEILKISDEEPSDSYYYLADICYKRRSFLLVLRFSEALNAFCRFHS